MELGLWSLWASAGQSTRISKRADLKTSPSHSLDRSPEKKEEQRDLQTKTLYLLSLSYDGVMVRSIRWYDGDTRKMRQAHVLQIRSKKKKNNVTASCSHPDKVSRPWLHTQQTSPSFINKLLLRPPHKVLAFSVAIDSKLATEVGEYQKRELGEYLKS